MMIAIAGVIMLFSLLFVYLFPNGIGILIACIACGLMNIVQAYKYLGDKRKRSMGMSMLLLGVCIIVVGFIIVVVS